MADVVTLGKGRLRGERGTWWPTVDDKGVRKAIVFCPECGATNPLTHDVMGLGIVSPSVFCIGSECNWHASLILAGWSRG